jgi:hypothetical protein
LKRRIAPTAYDAQGNAGLGAVNVFMALANSLAPKTLPR